MAAAHCDIVDIAERAPLGSDATQQRVRMPLVRRAVHWVHPETVVEITDAGSTLAPIPGNGRCRR